MEVVVSEFSQLPDYISEQFRQIDYTEYEEIDIFSYKGISITIVSDEYTIRASIHLSGWDLIVTKTKEKIIFVAINCSNISNPPTIRLCMGCCEDECGRSNINPVLGKWI